MGNTKQFLVLLLGILLPSLLAASPQVAESSFISVTFELEAPGLPDDTEVYVTGSLPGLGNWDPDKIKMTSLGENKWAFQLKVKAGSPIEYKYTLGSWEREAANAEGQPLPNFAVQPKADVTIKNRVLKWTDGKSRRVIGQITGKVRYHRQLEFDGLLPRDVIVWLPPGYDVSEWRCPVLYMHDGQNIIDPETSAFGVDWQVDEILTELISQGKVKPMIVVGIYNTRERNRDYLPGEQGDRYASFICEQLKPLIDQTYRTDPSREATAIAGSSAGGICAFAVAWERSDVFSKAICMSPAFRHERDDGTLTFDYVSRFAKSNRPERHPRFYLDNGGVGLEQILQPGIDAMLEAMIEKGLEAERDFVWRKYPEASHNEAAWAKRLPEALVTLFGESSADQ